MRASVGDHFNLWKVGRQQIEVSFEGGRLVNDAGLLAIRALDRSLGVVSDLAERLPDPRSPAFVRHGCERLLIQWIYQNLAGLPDGNDADTSREDPLMQILAEQEPDSESTLASRSTLNRFFYALTRRRQGPSGEDPLLWMRAAQTGRTGVVNKFLLDLFVRTREEAPEEIILDCDATDDPVHGQQHLEAYHGYYRQHQYYPLVVFEGQTGFPLAAWLRPGTVAASTGCVQVLQQIVTRLRQAWPEVRIRLRADNGFATPEVYAFCEDQKLGYALGYATNPVLERATKTAARDLETLHACYGRDWPVLQRFEEIRDYQAESWDHPRRVIAKIERTPQGRQRRFVVTNLSEDAEWVYREFYVKRGAVPEQPIGELKNGLQADRLSCHGFCANSFRFSLSAVSYALVVLFRSACRDIQEVATAQVSTLRCCYWKVAAVLHSSARRLHLRLSTSWPHRGVWVRIVTAVTDFAERLMFRGRAGPQVATPLLM